MIVFLLSAASNVSNFACKNIALAPYLSVDGAIWNSLRAKSADCTVAKLISDINVTQMATLQFFAHAQ
jgi:hypothetical protein